MIRKRISQLEHPFLFLAAALLLTTAACNGTPTHPQIAIGKTSSPDPDPANQERTGEVTRAHPSTAPDAGIWHPGLQTTWQWQLTDLPIDVSYDVEVYDIDLFDNDTAVVRDLHATGSRVICYMNAGGWEDWRPDATQFPDGVIGKELDGWPGEKWLDIRQIDRLAPILEARLDMCKQKGFDGVEPDNVDGYLNDTGFPLSYDDQLRFNRWLSEQAHIRGLSIGLKNDLEQIPDLVEYFDWALNEECFSYDECETLLPFIEAGKAVFHVEYDLETSEFCRRAIALTLNSMKKNWDLDAWQGPCW